MEQPFTGMYELLEAIEAVVKSSDPKKREILARTIDAYREDCPDEFLWATGAQSPLLLHHLFMSIDASCRPEEESRPARVIRLVDRKPEDNA